jgi:hypothetical protein
MSLVPLTSCSHYSPSTLRHRSRHQHALIVNQLLLAGGSRQRQVVTITILD